MYRRRLFLTPLFAVLVALAACANGAGLPSAPDQGYNGFVPPSTSQGSGSGGHVDRKSTRLNSSHLPTSRMPSSA